MRLSFKCLSIPNDGEGKQDIVKFVERVTNKSSPVFVPVEERVPVFDKDGTLWREQLLYFQGLFVIDRIIYGEPYSKQLGAKESKHEEERFIEEFK